MFKTISNCIMVYEMGVGGKTEYASSKKMRVMLKIIERLFVKH